MINPREDALRRTSAAAQRYEVSEADLARAADRLNQRCGLERHGVVAGYLHAHMLEVAEMHQVECASVGCRLCEAIGRTVAMMLVFLRAELDEEFREQMRRSEASRRVGRRLLNLCRDLGRVTFGKRVSSFPQR